MEPERRVIQEVAGGAKASVRRCNWGLIHLKKDPQICITML